MVKGETIIQNRTGFHLSPAQLFVQKSNKFRSSIKVKNIFGMEANGKSMLGLLTLGFEFGTKIIIEASGEDEETAVNELLELINNKFGIE